MSHSGGRRVARHRMNTRQKLLALAVVVLVLGATAGWLYYAYGLPGKAKLSTTPDCLHRRSGFCTGVALKAVSQKELAAFTATTGVFPSIVEYYQRFGKGFSQATAKQVALVGARPFIQLNPHNVSIASIARGRYDGYLRSYAADVKAFGHQVVLSFGHEMNGTWSTWSLPFTRPATFVAAWRHIVTVFRDAKVKNVTWAWDISHMITKSARPWWPGRAYVDWVGIDGYLRPGQTFAGQFWHQISVVRRLAGPKPVLITETAVAPGPKRVDQIHELFEGARRRHLIGLIWFNVNKKEPWQLVSGTPALAAFKQEAQ